MLCVIPALLSYRVTMHTGVSLQCNEWAECWQSRILPHIVFIIMIIINKSHHHSEPLDGTLLYSQVVHRIQVPWNSSTHSKDQENILFIQMCCSVCFLVGRLRSRRHTSVSLERICSDSVMCCHTETEVVDKTFYLNQSQYTDTRPTSPSTDPITPST